MTTTDTGRRPLPHDQQPTEEPGHPRSREQHPAAFRVGERGFVRRRVPTLPLADGRAGEFGYSRWMQFAGVDSRSVEVRGERVLYTAAGVILAAYTVYAFIGVFAFAQMATDSVVQAVVAALVIGLILVGVNLSIDRGLIGYVPARLDNVDDLELDRQPVLNSSSVRWARRLRVLLAILFALAVGEPANLFLFSKDVDAAMAVRNQSVIVQQRELSNKTYADQIAAQQAIVDAASTRITAINAGPEDLLAKAQAERAGAGATGESGCGTQCRQYIAEAEAARASAPALVAAEQAKITAANEEISRLNVTKNTEAADAETFSAANTGFLAREQALIAALKEDPVLLFRYLVIVIVFFCLEMGAILTKYLAKGNNYERESARRARLAEYASIVRARSERGAIEERDQINRQLHLAADEHFLDTNLARMAEPGAQGSVQSRSSAVTEPIVSASPDDLSSR